MDGEMKPYWQDINMERLLWAIEHAHDHDRADEAGVQSFPVEGEEATPTWGSTLGRLHVLLHRWVERAITRL